MKNIPIIDFKHLILSDKLNENDLLEWKEIGRQVFQACSEFGYFYIKNHGIPQDQIDDQFKIAKGFFNLSDNEKNKYGIQPDNYGYCGMDQETLDDDTAPDPKEVFNVWTSRTKISPERIPPHFANKQEHIDKFSSICHQLSVKILRSFAFGLQLKDPQFFDECTKFELPSGTTMRYLHYPPIPNSSPEQINRGIIRAGAHSDYGLLTLLFQSPCGQLDSEFSGLQVLHDNNRWINVGNIEGCIVVNTGDLMSIWTEGRFKSAVHRVIVPNQEISKIHRYSMAFFCSSNSDYFLYPLETPVEAPHPAKEVTNPQTCQTEYHSAVGASPFKFGENDVIYFQRRLTATTHYK